MARRTRFFENYRGRRVVKQWLESRTLDEGFTKHHAGHWTDGVSGFPRKTIQEVREWIDQQEQA